ncbi:unnamed protein product [Linum trigynum]|uniref:Transposase n=1 Tax=Linum trigynum TaxID=586398 RepID=A0AAV2F547_9ROSI
MNVLGVCNSKLEFLYCLAGWEGSTHDGKVLRDASLRPNGLRVLKGIYYLCDQGYSNFEGFLTPYRGQQMGRKIKEIKVEGEEPIPPQPKGPYFCWNEALDGILIECMLELVEKHQVENGNFKNGAFTKLKTMMNQKLPGCGVKVEPNIRSRHRKLKRDFMVVHLLRSKSRQGWDELTLTPMIDDDVFADLLKVHLNTKNLNKTPFPHYYKLLQIFGKGGTAQGRVTCGISDPVYSPQTVVNLDDLESPIDLEDPKSTEILMDIMSKGIEKSLRETGGPQQTQSQPIKEEKSAKAGVGSNSTIKKKAKKLEFNNDEAIANVVSELGGLKLVISKAVEALGSIMGDRGECRRF